MQCLNPANSYLFKVNNLNTRKRCEICSKLTIKTLELMDIFEQNIFHFILFPNVSLVDFDQVNISWEIILWSPPRNYFDIFITLFFPIFIFYPHESIRKTKVFWCFQGDQKETLERKGLRYCKKARKNVDQFFYYLVKTIVALKRIDYESLVCEQKSGKLV